MPRAYRRFWISTDPTDCGRRFYFHLYVYRTDTALRQAAAKYSPHENEPDFWDSCVGCFQPRVTFWINDDGSRAPTPKTSFIGVMRLSMQHLEPHIVIHESTHAAIALVQAAKLIKAVHVGTYAAMPTEEALCHSVHEISMAVLKAAGLH